MSARAPASAHQDQLAGHTVDETFTQAAEFLTLTVTQAYLRSPSLAAGVAGA
jgi:hypothetical protein